MLMCKQVCDSPSRVATLVDPLTILPLCALQIPKEGSQSGDRVQCFDPSTLLYLGFTPAMSASEVGDRINMMKP